MCLRLQYLRGRCQNVLRVSPQEKFVGYVEDDSVSCGWVRPVPTPLSTRAHLHDLEISSDEQRKKETDE